MRMLAVHALLLCGIGGCRRGEIGGGVTDSTYVAVMTALTLINEDDSRDSAQRAAARDSVLQSKDLTASDMERVARVLSDDPDRAVEAWQRIMKARGPERPR
jgi:hypothetical protein